MHLRKSVALAALTCVPAVVACGGGKSPAEKAKDGAAQAKAACEVFTHLKTPSGSDDSAQIAAAKVSATAFAKASDLASAAAADDATWTRLASSAKAESDSFAIIVKAATKGFTAVGNERNVLKAVQIAKGARPVFIGECAKADPAKFTPIPTPTATATGTATPSATVTTKNG
ncbi:MAG TPA: hypothetical protein VHD81_08010 [Mycobacteriales bacterium]|nr:hypothetical protein [Mycobacteriales bacterium]